MHYAHLVLIRTRLSPPRPPPSLLFILLPHPSSPFLSSSLQWKSIARTTPMGTCVSTEGVIAPKIRVVQAQEGRVVTVELSTHLQSSMKVGELLLEFPPGHFVAQLSKPDLLTSTSKRATPLRADADAKPGDVYVLLPMPRLHTRISPQELLSFAKLLHLQGEQLTRAIPIPSKVHVDKIFTVRARVAPIAEEECKDAHLHRDADTEEQMPGDNCIVSPCYGMKAKPWAPMLQTIMESS